MRLKITPEQYYELPEWYFSVYNGIADATEADNKRKKRSK